MSAGSFSASLSGLNANQQKLSVIGNNLANINTVALQGEHRELRRPRQPVGRRPEREPDADRPRRRASARSRRTSRRAASRTPASRPTSRSRAPASSWSATPRTARYTRAGNFSFDANGTLVTRRRPARAGLHGDRSGDRHDRHDRPADEHRHSARRAAPAGADDARSARRRISTSTRDRRRDVHHVGADLRLARRRARRDRRRSRRPAPARGATASPCPART